MTSKRDLPPKFSEWKDFNAKGGMRFAFPPYGPLEGYRVMCIDLGLSNAEPLGEAARGAPSMMQHKKNPWRLQTRIRGDRADGGRIARL
jgi:hypothetical protein